MTLSPQAYGSLQGWKPKDDFFSKPRSLNLVAIISNIFFPWLAFVLIFWALAFYLRHEQPFFAWLVVACGVLAVAASAFSAWRLQQRGRPVGWYGYFAVSMFISVALSTSLANMTYRAFMEPVYDSLFDLKDYKDVSPNREKGAQLMDAGYVSFSKGSAIDFRKAMSFRDRKTYCVAPISDGQDKMANYDFWAVGVDCCSGVSTDFRCGEYNNPYARSGLRLLRDEERPFYRLAVEQAEAAYGIRSAHPQFFTWVEDPEEIIGKWRSFGFKCFVLGILGHFGLSVLCVLAALFGFQFGWG